MRTFACARCHQLVFFENTACLHCGAALAFRWADRELVTLAADDGAPRCANAQVAGCNALVEQPGERCFSCALTRTRPADGDTIGLSQLAAAEAAKRRLLFELGELGLPLVDRAADPEAGLAFDLLSSEHEPVTTGHADGIVTLDLAESDAAHRVKLQTQMGEPYRTLLGHFRHEIAHFLFPRLAPEDSVAVDRCRALFGDDREDYAAAMDRHYADGAPADWPRAFASAYATMHPYEDWAETFAHYLHIRDTAQTAVAYGVRVAGPSPPRAQDETVPGLAFVPRAHRQDMRELLDDWLPLTYALNALNRSMGAEDLYPFVLPEPVVEKLALVDELVLTHAVG